MRARLWEALRHYWSAAVFVAAAGALVAAGAPARAALAGAGFALLGAAFTRGVDIARERATSRQRELDARRRDLDETRRLAYVALHAKKSLNAQLIATLVNALAHHQSAVDPETAVEHVTAVVDGLTAYNAKDVQWLKDQIDQINRQIGDAADKQDR